MQQPLPASAPFKHFDSKKPDGGIQGYKNLSLCTDLWLDMTPEHKKKIAAEYSALNHLHDNPLSSDCDNGSEYFIFALSKLFCATPLTSTYIRPASVVERMLDFDPRGEEEDSNGRSWRSPSLVKDDMMEVIGQCGLDDIRDYTFDVPPNIQYWLVGAAFESSCNLEERLDGCGRTDTFQRLCPYLSINIRDAGEETSPESANEESDLMLGRLASSMAVALYNRCLLRINRLTLTRRKWTLEQFKAIRHYGIGLNSDVAHIWVARACVDQYDDLPFEPICPFTWSWSGCEIVNLDQVTVEGSLVDWINEIHR